VVDVIMNIKTSIILKNLSCAEVFAGELTGSGVFAWD